MNLRVHIDHLRIDGADLTPADAPRLRDALADELRRQLADHHAREHRDVPRLRAPDVAATSDVKAWVELRAALADDDRPSGYNTAVEHLHAEALGFRIAAVLGGTATFGLRHGSVHPLEMPVISMVASVWRCPHRRRLLDLFL